MEGEDELLWGLLTVAVALGISRLWFLWTPAPTLTPSPVKTVQAVILCNESKWLSLAHPTDAI